MRVAPQEKIKVQSVGLSITFCYLSGLSGLLTTAGRACPIKCKWLQKRVKSTYETGKTQKLILGIFMCAGLFLMISVTLHLSQIPSLFQEPRDIICSVLPFGKNLWKRLLSLCVPGAHVFLPQCLWSPLGQGQDKGLDFTDHFILDFPSSRSLLWLQDGLFLCYCDLW